MRIKKFISIVLIVSMILNSAQIAIANGVNLNNVSNQIGRERKGYYDELNSPGLFGGKKDDEITSEINKEQNGDGNILSENKSFNGEDKEEEKDEEKTNIKINEEGEQEQGEKENSKEPEETSKEEEGSSEKSELTTTTEVNIKQTTTKEPAEESTTTVVASSDEQTSESSESNESTKSTEPSLVEEGTKADDNNTKNIVASESGIENKKEDIATSSETEKEEEKIASESNTSQVATISSLFEEEVIVSSNSNALFGADNLPRVDKVTFDENGIMTFYILFPPNDTSGDYTENKLRNNFSAFLGDIYYPLYKNNPSIKASFGGLYYPSYTDYAGENLISFDSVNGEAVIESNFSSIMSTSSGGGLDDLKENFGGYLLDFTTIHLFNNSDNFAQNASGQKTVFTKICTTLNHVWKNDWRESWTICYNNGNGTYNESINNKLSTIRRIGIIDSQTAWKIVTGHYYDGYNPYGVLGADYYYNSSLKLQALGPAYDNGNSTQPGEEILFFILDDGESIIFDGNNSKALFKNSQVVNVDWAEIGRRQQGIDNHLTTMESWFEGVDFRQTGDSIEGVTGANNYYGTEGCPRLDMFIHLDTSKVTSLKNMFKGATDVVTALEVFTDYEAGGSDSANLSGTNIADDPNMYNTLAVTDMSGMFESAIFNFRRSRFKNIIERLQTDNVTTMERMFKTTNHMFAWNSGGHGIDLSKFVTHNLTNISEMFRENNFTSVVVDDTKWDISHVTKDNNVFYSTGLIGENGSRFNDGFVRDDKYAARRDTYLTPGLFCIKEGIPNYTKLQTVRITSIIKNNSGWYTHPGEVGESRGLIGIDAASEVYRSAIHDRGENLDPMVLDYNPYQDRFRIKGYRPGDIFALYQKRYDKWTWPNIGDNAYRYGNSFSKNYVEYSGYQPDAAYEFIGYQDINHKTINFDEEEMTFGPDITIATETSTYRNQIYMVWQEADAIATFKSQYILTEDVKKWFAAFGHIKPIKDLVKNRVYDIGGGTYRKFLYWQKEGTTGEYDFLNNSESGDVTFNAVWQEVEAFTVSFVDNNNYVTNIPSVLVEKNGKAQAPDVPASGYRVDKTSYQDVFVYWHKDGEDTPFNFNNPITEDITLYAKWKSEPYKYQVDFKSDYLGPFPSQEVMHGQYAVDNMGLFEGCIYKVGEEYYRFNGWRDSNNQKIEDVAITTDTEFVAQWGNSLTGTFYKITFVAQHGYDAGYKDIEIWTTEEIMKNEGISVNLIPNETMVYESNKMWEYQNGYYTKPGGPYVSGAEEYSSWYNDVVWYDSAHLTSDKTFYAYWIENTNYLTITYQSDYGTINPEKKFLKRSYSTKIYNHEVNESMTEIYYQPTSPRIGDIVYVDGWEYALTKWTWDYYGYDEDLPYDFIDYDDPLEYSSDFNSSFTLKAVWMPTGAEERYIEVKFKSQYNSEHVPPIQKGYLSHLPYTITEPTNAYFNKNISMSTDGTNNYRFKYWYETDPNVPFDFTQGVSVDTTLNAKWEKTNDIILFYDASGTTLFDVSDIKLNIGGVVISANSQSVQSGVAINNYLPVSPVIDFANPYYKLRGWKYEDENHIEHIYTDDTVALTFDRNTTFTPVIEAYKVAKFIGEDLDLNKVTMIATWSSFDYPDGYIITPPTSLVKGVSKTVVNDKSYIFKYWYITNEDVQVDWTEEFFDDVTFIAKYDESKEWTVTIETTTRCNGLLDGQTSKTYKVKDGEYFYFPYPVYSWWQHYSSTSSYYRIQKYQHKKYNSTSYEDIALTEYRYLIERDETFKINMSGTKSRSGLCSVTFYSTYMLEPSGNVSILGSKSSSIYPISVPAIGTFYKDPTNNKIYEMKGWSTTNGGSVTYSSMTSAITLATGNYYSFYAVWSEVNNVVTVEFVDDYREAPEQKIITKNTKTTKPTTHTDGEAPIMVGSNIYTFIGWFKQGETTEFDFDNTNIADSIIIEARYTKAAKATVTYDIQNAAEISKNPRSVSVVIGATLSEPTTISKGYLRKIYSGGVYTSAERFDYWYQDGTTTPYDFENTPVNASFTMKGHWTTLSVYDVTYNAVHTNEFITNPPSEKVAHGEKATRPTNINTNTEYIERDVNGNIVDNKKFKYWYHTNPNEAFDFENTGIIGPTALTASWSTIQYYQVTFTNTHGITVPSQSVKENTKASKPTQISNDQDVIDNDVHYVFKRWSEKSAAFDVEYDFNTQITAPLELEGRWEPYVKIVYTSTISSANVPSEQTINLNQDLTTIDIIVEPSSSYFQKDNTVVTVGTDNYRFKYWYSTSSNVPYDFTNTPNKNTEIKAFWKKIEYVTLTYDPSPMSTGNLKIQSSIGYGVTTQTVEQGKAITTYFPYRPSLGSTLNDGGVYKKLTGWKYIDENNVEHLLTNGSTAIAFNQDTTISAEWEEEKKYTFKGLDKDNPEYVISSNTWYNYDNPGGKIIPSNITYGGRAVEKNVYKYRNKTTRTASLFKYWYSTDSNIEFDFTVPQFDSVTLYPKWEDVPFKWEVKMWVSNQGSSASDDYRFEGVIDGLKEKYYEFDEGETLRFEWPVGSYYKNIGYTGSTSRYQRLRYYSRKNGSSWDILWRKDYESDNYETKELVITKDEEIRLYFESYTTSESSRKTKTFKYELDLADDKIDVFNDEYEYFYPPTRFFEDDEYTVSATGIKYKFIGWSDTQAKNAITTWPKKGGGNQTFWASWSEVTTRYVTYVDNYRTAPAAVSLITGEKTTRPTTHAPGEADIVVGTETYRFIDWYEVGSTTPFDFNNTKIYFDKTIEARYRRVQTVTFDIVHSGATYSGGNLDTPINQNILRGDTVSAPNIFDNNLIITAGTSRYRFRYWWATSSTVPYDFALPVDDDMTLTAEWLSLGSQRTYRFLGIDPSNPDAELTSGTWFDGDYPGGYIISSNLKDTSNVDIVKDVYSIKDEANKTQQTFKYWYSTDSNIEFDFSVPQFDDVTLRAKYMTEKIKWYVTMQVSYNGNASSNSYRFEGVLDEQYEKKFEVRDGETFRFEYPAGAYYRRVGYSDFYRLNYYQRKKEDGNWDSNYLWYYGSSSQQTKEIVVTKNETIRMYFYSNTTSNLYDHTFIWGLDIPQEVFKVYYYSNYYPPTTYLINDVHTDSTTGIDYKFFGWKESNSPTATVLKDSDWPKYDSGAKTYWAEWKPTYDVSFDSLHEGASYSGGTITNPPTQKLAKAELVTRPSDFNENTIITIGSDEYRFKYWWATSSTVPYDFSLPVDGDMTLTAKWQILQNQKTYKFVGIDPNDPSSELLSGTWYESEYPSGYIISSNVKDSSNVDIVKDVYSIKNTTTKRQHTFKYWYSTDSNIEFDFSVPQKDDVVLHAKWKEEKIKWIVTITVNRSGYTSDDKFEGVIDGEHTKTYEVVDGEKFRFMYPVGTYYKRIDDTSSYPYWQIQNYQQKNGTSWNTVWDNGSNKNKEVTINKDEEFRINFYNSASGTSSSMYTKTFVWGPDYDNPTIATEYFKVYSSNSFYPPTTYLINDKYLEVSTGKKYKFVGWKTSKTATTVLADSSWPRGNYSAETFYASWQEVSEKTVTFEDDYVTPPAQIEVNSGEKITRPSTHTSGEADIIVGTEKYRFIDWYEDGSTTPFDFANTTITTDITIKAIYLNVSEYNITYNINMPGEESKEPASEIKVWGSLVATPTTIDAGYIRREYNGGLLNKVYRFDYWYLNNSNVPFDFNNTLVKYSFTLTAKWTEIPVYFVTFTNTHNVVVATQSMVSGGKATTPSEISVGYSFTQDDVNYNFAKWVKKNSLTDDAFDFENTLITSDIEIEARWDANVKVEYQSTYNATHLPSDEIIHLDNTLNPINAITEPVSTYFEKGVSRVTVSGNKYRFNYWYSTSSNVPYDFTITPNKNTTMIASWSIIEYVTINYNAKEFGQSSVILLSGMFNVFADNAKFEKGMAITNEYFPVSPSVGEVMTGAPYAKMYGWKWVDHNGVEHIWTNDANPVTFYESTTVEAITEKRKTGRYEGLSITNPSQYLTSKNWYNNDNPTGYKLPAVVKDSSGNDIIKGKYVLKDATNKKQYRFKYWYSISSGSDCEFNFDEIQTKDVTLRALFGEEPLTWDVTIETDVAGVRATFSDILDTKASKTITVANGTKIKFDYPIGARYKKIDNNNWYKVSKYGRKNGTSWTTIWDATTGTDEYTINQDETIKIYLEDALPESNLVNKTFNFVHGKPNKVIRVKNGDDFIAPNDYAVNDIYNDPVTGNIYQFEGWYLSTDATKTILTWPQNNNLGDQEFTASWLEISDRLVRYFDDYVATPPEVSVPAGGTISRPTTHMPGEADIIVGTEKYRFIDWFEKGNSTPFDFSAPIYSNKDIEARYQNVTIYNVDFNINMVGEDAKKPADQPVIWGGKLTTPSTIKRGYVRKEYNTTSGLLENAYRFDYWYSTDSNIPYDFENVPVKSSFTMTAKWTTLSVYDVTFDAVYTNSTITTPSPQRIIGGEYATTPSNIDINTLWERRNGSNIVVEAHRFKYWYETDDTIPFDFKNIQINKTTHLTATWSTIPLYKVEFTDTTGYLALSQLATYTLPTIIEGINEGSKIATPTEISIGTVVKVGVGSYYQFNGWYNGVSRFDFENTNINADYTLDANWSPFSGAVVTFEKNGHFTGRTIAQQTVYPDVHIQLPVAPSGINAGEYEEVNETDGFIHRYTFTHWYLSTDTTESPYNFNVDPTSNITLVAKYTNQKYNTIKFNLSGIEVVSTPSDQEKLDGELVTKPTVLTENQNYNYSGHTYRFDYWYATNSTVAYNFNRPVDNNYEISAHWTDVTPWHINYDAVHVANPAQDTVTNGNKATAPASIDTNTVKVYTDAVTGERTAAYRFKYWYETDDTVAFDFAGTDIFRDYNLTATWSSIPLYNVTFADPDGRLGTSILPSGLTVPTMKRGLYQGEKVATPSIIKENDVVKVGVGQYYKFLGWYIGPANTVKYDFNAGVTATITLNAKWSPFTGATVTFDNNGHFTGRTIAQQTVYPDVHIQLPVAPSGINAGEHEENLETDGFVHRYTFVHWYLDGGDENIAYDFSIDPTSDITLKAKYNNQKYNTIKFNLSGIEVVATPSNQVKLDGEKITKPAVPVANQNYPYSGHTYRFDYWYATSSTVAYNFNRLVDNNYEMKAHWTDVTQWRVTFEVGKSYTDQTKYVVNGNAVTPLIAPVAGTLYEPKDSNGVRTEASRFLHWYLSTDATKTPFDFTTPIVGDITLKGEWDDLGLYSIVFTDTENVFANEDVEAIYRRSLPNTMNGIIEGETIAEPTMIHINEIVRTVDNSTVPPLIQHHKFNGWYNGTTPFDFTAALPATTTDTTITLNAKWITLTVNIYEVTYTSQHMPPSKTKEYVEEGNTVLAPTRPAPNQEVTTSNMYYRFDYWYATDSNIPFDFSTAIYEHYDLKAKWFAARLNTPTPAPTPTEPSSPSPGGGIIPGIPLDTPIDPKTGETEDKIRKTVDDFIESGDVTVIDTPGVDVDELIKLRKLIKNESNDDDDLTEDPRKSWHKISKSVWYYANRNVGLLRGWLRDEQDTQFYHLDEKTGIMSVGWTKLGDYYYYFSEEPNSDNWYCINGEWTTRNRNDISIGSMYINARTPDGFFVDQYGHYVESAGQLSTAQMLKQVKTEEEFLATQKLTINQERELENVLDVNTMKEIEQLREREMTGNNQQANNLPTNTMQANTMPTNVMPTNALQANVAQTNIVQTNAMQTNIMQSIQGIQSNEVILEQATMAALSMTAEELEMAKQDFYKQLAYQQELADRMAQGDKSAEQEYLSIIEANKSKIGQIK